MSKVINEDELKKLNLTELEEKFIRSYLPMLYEYEFSDVDVNDIAKDTGISNKILRGVLGNLIKKGILELPWEGDMGIDKSARGIIYLSQDYYKLHLDWID